MSLQDRHEVAGDDDTRTRMVDLLTRTANALHGEPAPLTRHAWHDLPERAQSAMDGIASMAAVLRETERVRDVALAMVKRLQQDCVEAYQVIGAGMLGEPCAYTKDDVERVLDNLAAASAGLQRPHQDLLPWPKTATGEPSAAEHLPPPAGGCGACGDSCVARGGSCRLREESPQVPSVDLTERSAGRAMDELRRSVAEIIGTDPDTWPDHGNTPLAIAAALALRHGAVKGHAAALEQAVEAEREACAALCDQQAAREPYGHAKHAAGACAEAIRARGAQAQGAQE